MKKFKSLNFSELKKKNIKSLYFNSLFFDLMRLKFFFHIVPAFVNENSRESMK